MLIFDNYLDKIDWHLVLLISGIGLFVVAVIIVFLVIGYKTYRKLIIRKNAQITTIEQQLNELFEKRVSILSAFNKDAKVLETPNLYTNMKAKAAFKKDTDTFIKNKLTNDVLMNNNAEIAQIVNEYNKRAEEFNKMIRHFPANVIAERFGFRPYELYDESTE